VVSKGNRRLQHGPILERRGPRTIILLQKWEGDIGGRPGSKTYISTISSSRKRKRRRDELAII